MDRAIAVVGATSSLGIRPYDDGEMRHLNRAPEVLRGRGLIDRLRADDLGNVLPPPYRDFVRPPGRARNEAEVIRYSRLLADRVASATAHGRFGLVVGGDCSVVLGCVLGARRQAGGPIGLVYLDAHADFATPEESRTGSAASMTLALATGRGDTALARLWGRTPLVNSANVALLGRRDAAEPWYGHSALAASGILDVPEPALMSRDPESVAAETLERVASADVAGFWIQVDADVINPAFMSAVDSPEPGGPLPDELLRLLTPLVLHPKALGLSLTIYDPALDPDRSGALQLVSLLESVFAKPTT